MVKSLVSAITKTTSELVVETSKKDMENLSVDDVTPAVSGSGSDDDEGELAIVNSDSSGDHDLDPIEVVFTGEPGTIEPTTGISYPHGLNSYKLIGCGVRTKYLVFHAYAVGFYMDINPSVVPEGLKTDKDIVNFLLDPKYPKMFRLVMNRNVTSSQYIGATMERMTPLMRGKDLDKLAEMKKQKLPKILNSGTEIYCFIDDDKLIMQLSTVRARLIESKVLTRALCENYLGDDPVSPAMKKVVMQYMQAFKK